MKVGHTAKRMDLFTVVQTFMKYTKMSATSILHLVSGNSSIGILWYYVYLACIVWLLTVYTCWDASNSVSHNMKHEKANILIHNRGWLHAFICCKKNLIPMNTETVTQCACLYAVLFNMWQKFICLLHVFSTPCTMCLMWTVDQMTRCNYYGAHPHSVPIEIIN